MCQDAVYPFVLILQLTAKSRNTNYTRAWKYLGDMSTMEHEDINVLCGRLGTLHDMLHHRGAIAVYLRTLCKTNPISQQLGRVIFSG